MFLFSVLLGFFSFVLHYNLFKITQMCIIFKISYLAFILLMAVKVAGILE